MTGVVKLLNGYLPVKTLHGIQMSGEPSIPPRATVGVWRTNLCHDHTKSENICFRCRFIASLENLWRGPCLSICLYRRHKNGIQPANK